MRLSQRFADPEYGFLLTPITGQILSSWIVTESRRPRGIAFGAAVIAIFALWGWIMVWRRRRASADTPTSTVAGAAQGYVELFGKALPHDGHLIKSKHGRRECVWFRWKVEEKSGDKWRLVEKGASSETFLLRDATGDCVIDPDGAQVSTSLRISWYNAPYRFTEWVIRPGAPLYALGHFRSVDEADPVSDQRDAVNRLLNEWKKDRPGLVRRFDLNGDGEIDMAEWELARKAAHHEAALQAAPPRDLPELHVLGASPDGRPFILSNSNPDREAKRHGGLLDWYVGSFAAASVAALVFLLRDLR
jgi:hypothetical protein